jgi:DNA-binding transcriptional regulator YhcF (GntR family)
VAEFKYKTVINEIIGQIECGQLSGKLMSVRKLAKLKQLGVSTVVQAYHELEHLGWITAMPKQGYTN